MPPSEPLRTLIDATTLRRRLDSGERIVLLDCGFDLADADAGARAHAAGHLPGAHYAHLEHDLSGPKTAPGPSFSGRHPLPERAAFARRAAAWGIGEGTPVVCHDDHGSPYAARAWWLLRWLGHADVAVLDGGRAAWRDAGGKLEQALAPTADDAPPYPALAPSMPTIDAATLVDEIILSTRTECLAEMAELCRRCGLQKPVRVVVGGETRTHSVLAAALEANEKARLIAVHDGARPLIRPEQIDELIRFGERTYAAAPAVPVSDTIKRTEPSTGRVLETPDRAALFAVQTPQVFQAELLKAALQSAVNAEVTLTDDCSAVERLGKEVYLTAGDPENIKITRPLDLRLAEAILAERRKQA